MCIRDRVGPAGGATAASLRAAVDARVRGEDWPRELTLAGELTTRTAGGGGEWRALIRAADREVARFTGILPEPGADWRLRWWADFRSEEVARMFPEPRWAGERVLGEGELRWLPESGLVAVQGKAEVELGAAGRGHRTLGRRGVPGGLCRTHCRRAPRIYASRHLSRHDPNVINTSHLR